MIRPACQDPDGRRSPYEAPPHGDVLHRLVSVVQYLSFCRTMEDIVAIVRRAGRELTGCDGITFVLREEDRVHYVDEDAVGPLWKGQRFPIQACISGWCIINRQIVVINDVYADQRVPHDAYRPTFVKSMVMVPIRTIDPVGSIGAYWASVRSPPPDELRVLQALADATAIAIANVRLYESLHAARAAAEDHALENRRLLEAAKLEIAERRRTEAALQQAKREAELADMAKTRFLGAAGHDMRQPIQAAMVFASLLERRCQSPEIKDLAHQIGRSLAATKGLLDALLDIARLDAGVVCPQLAAVPLQPMFDRLAQEFGPMAAQNGNKVRWLRSDAIVWTDPVLMERIVRQLVGNAIRYTERGRVLVGCRHHDGDILLQVWDTGIGISSDKLDVIFEEFYQVGNPERDRAKGLGLGLAVVKRLVSLVGHPLHVHSTPGKGSMFEIRLHRADPPADDMARTQR